MTTTEDFLHGVRTLVLERALKRDDITHDEYSRLSHTKLVYGSGGGMGARGVTFYGAWSNGHGPTELVEVCAVAQESWVQLAGTLIHELGHVLAGHGAGHQVAWKDACVRLGFRIRPAAAGQVYWLAMLPPDLREDIYRLAQRVDDGTPAFRTVGAPRRATRSAGPRPCSAGQGTRGGTSRGKGSGSRMLKLICPNDGYTVRTTRKWLDVGSPSCPCGEVLTLDK